MRIGLQRGGGRSGADLAVAVARSRMLGAGALTAAAAVLVVAAIGASGFAVDHVRANDGAVWVTDNAVGSFGRFDYPVFELDAAFGPPGSFQAAYDLDVLQSGTTVLAMDRNRGDLYSVDAEDGGIVGPGVALSGGGEAQVALGGPVAAVLNPESGEVWTAVVGSATGGSLVSLDATAAPRITLSGATAMTVGQDGSVYVASPTRLVTIPYRNGNLGSPWTTVIHAHLGRQLSLSVVGGTAVVLDAADEQVLVPATGRVIDIPGASSSEPDAIQQAGPAASSVLVATTSGLYSLPLGGGAVVSVASGADGVPAEPVRLGGCEYAAWSGAPGYYAESCTGSALWEGNLTGVATVSQPVFRVNNADIVLNDLTDGATWSLGRTATAALDAGDWQRLLSSTQSVTQQPSQVASAASAPQDQPPKAVDETFEARAGLSTILHLLDQDSDPDGSVLCVTAVTPPTGTDYTLQIAPDMQTVAISLSAGDTQAVDFQYTVLDARGLTATASVTVTPTTGETPPHLRSGFTPVTRAVASDSTASYPVLGDWRDDQGDPLVLTDASASVGQVTWSDDGEITYTSPVMTTDTMAVITYHVTDGLSTPVAGELQVRVLGTSDVSGVAPVAVPIAAEVVVGEAAVIRPLPNDIAGADPLHPGAQLVLAQPVTPAAGLTASTDLTSGDVTLNAQQAGVYSLTYEVAFGSAPAAQGQILIDARAASGTAVEPVTTPVAALLRGQLATTVDVLAGDYDPSGGLLTVVEANAPAGLQVAVVDGEWLRLEATSAGLSTPEVVDYEVTDGDPGTSPVTGQVTATWLPVLTPAPPVVPTLYATVRAGDETDIAALQSATDPAGEPMTLVPAGVAIAPVGAGAASIEGGTLRYAAPPAAGVSAVETVTVSYQVEDTSGESTTGHVVLTVNPAAAADSAAPEPVNVDARVVAGGTIAIPIPTTGVDPGGDSVSVVGITSAPSDGRVVTVQANSITYQAYPESAGTDQLTYAVETASGLTAEAEVRIDVTPPSLVPPPVAVDDNVIAAPGSTVTVDVLANDIIAAGDSVTLLPLASTNATVPVGAQLDGDQLQVTAPTGAVPEVVTYGITDGTSVSKAQVTVNAQPGYVTPPVAVDYYPAVPAGQTAVTVNVMVDDYDPAGTTDDLTVSQVFGAGVKVEGNDLVIPVQATPRAVAYQVRNPEGATAVAVVHVPGAASGPVLRADATIQVPAGGTVTVDLNSYISDSRGQKVQLVSSAGVSVSPEAGLTAAVLSYTGLRLGAAGGYTGPGSLSVDVTDGTSPDDPHALTAVVIIPVQVGPPEPVLRCPTTPITVTEGGTPQRLNLASVCSVWTPQANQAGSLTFTERWTSSPIADVTLGWANGSDQVLVVTPGSAAQPGSGASVTVGISGSSATGTLSISVVAAPPPTVLPITVPGVETSHTATVDLTQYVDSPLADPKIEVVNCAQTSPSPEAAISCPAGGSTVAITPPPGTHGTMTFSVQVTDVPGRADRTVAGSITLQVLDAPGAATDLEGVLGNQEVGLSWVAAPDNGAPIDYYVVSVAGETTSYEVPGTAYTWTGLTNGTTYQFTVQAHNQVGLSTTSVTGAFMPQAAPGATGAVAATPGDGEVSLSWGAANPNGQAIDHYEISVTPPPSSGSALVSAAGTATSYTWSGLDNDAGPYTFTVAAHNALGTGPSAQSAAVYAFGTPPTPAAPTATGAVSPDQTTTTITVSFPAIDPCNDDQPCTAYKVTELRDGSTDTTSSAATGCGSDLCATFGPLTNDGSSYTYELQATNREGETSAASAPSAPSIAADGQPGTIDDLSGSAGNGSVSLSFTLPASNGSGIAQVDYTATNSSGGSSPTGSWLNPGASHQGAEETISGLTNGDTYDITVAACNEAGECGVASNTATVMPYGPPGPPTVAASPSGDTITYSWTGGGGNGEPVDAYWLCFDGSCAGVGVANPGSVQYTYACATGHTMTAYVVDAKGQDSTTASASATTAACPTPTPAPTPPPTAPPTAPPQSISFGEGPRQTDSSCTSAACAGVDFSMTSYSSNTNYTIAFTECGSPPEDCTSQAVQYQFTLRTNGSGDASYESEGSSNPFLYGIPGNWIGAEVNGALVGTVQWK
jgi:hypothetical protein